MSEPPYRTGYPLPLPTPLSRPHSVAQQKECLSQPPRTHVLTLSLALVLRWWNHYLVEELHVYGRPRSGLVPLVYLGQGVNR